MSKTPYWGMYAGINNVYEPLNLKTGDVKPFAVMAAMGAYGDFWLKKDLRLEVGFGLMYYGAKNLRYDLVVDSAAYGRFNYGRIFWASYITMPVLLKWSCMPHQSIVAGAQVSCLFNNLNINYFDSTDDLGIEINGSSEQINDLRIPTNQFGVSLMAGYEINPLKHWYISLLYNYGLVPVISSKTAADLSSRNIAHIAPNQAGNWNNSLMLRICYSSFEDDKAQDDMPDR